MKTTCKKAWPVNLKQVLKLTVDPCCKIEWVIILKWPYISYVLVFGLGTEHLVGSVYFLQLKLYLRYFQISMLLPI